MVHLMAQPPEDTPGIGWRTPEDSRPARRGEPVHTKWGGHQKEALAEPWWPPSKEDPLAPLEIETTARLGRRLGRVRPRVQTRVPCQRSGRRSRRPHRRRGVHGKGVDPSVERLDALVNAAPLDADGFRPSSTPSNDKRVGRRTGTGSGGGVRYEMRPHGGDREGERAHGADRRSPRRNGRSPSSGRFLTDLGGAVSLSGLAMAAVRGTLRWAEIGRPEGRIGCSVGV
jgi:hypothetical protein